MTARATTAYDNLDDAVAALGAGLYVHAGDGTPPRLDASRSDPDVPAGIRAVPADDLAGLSEGDGGLAVVLRPSKGTRFRTLDSSTYTAVRFDGDFVRLYGLRGADAHAALREAMHEVDPRARPFQALCLVTRHLAERGFLDRGVIDPEGARRAWAGLLGNVGYDVMVDRGGTVLGGGGTRVLVMREEVVRAVATAPVPRAPAPAGP